jgi:hypothetical protein
MDPVAQGAMSVNLDSGGTVKEEAYIFNHEVFISHLQWSYPVFMAAACRDHVAGWVVRWASYHFPSKIHLLSHDHFSYAGDGVKHFLYFVVA